jgi:hypothetical protein
MKMLEHGTECHSELNKSFYYKRIIIVILIAEERIEAHLTVYNWV